MNAERVAGNRYLWVCDCGAVATSVTYGGANVGAAYHAKVTGHEFPRVERS